MKFARLLFVFVIACLLQPTIANAESPTPPPPAPYPLIGAVAERLSEIELLDHDGGSVYVLDVEGHYVYAGVGTQLSIIDIGDATQPKRVGYLTLSEYPMAISVVGDWAYVLTRAAGGRQLSTFHIVDVSVPTTPLRVASVELVGIPSGLWVNSDIVYSLSVDDGLTLIDVARPHQPDIFYRVDFEESVHGLVGDDDALYVIGYGAGLFTLDLADLRRPVIVDRQDGFWPLAIEKTDEYVFTLSCERKVAVYQLTDKLSPVHVASFDPGLCPRSFDIEDGYLYVATADRGLVIYDIADPTLPVEVQSVSEFGLSNYVSVSGGVVVGNVVSDESRGLVFADVSEPGSTTVVGSYITETGSNIHNGEMPDIKFPGVSGYAVRYRDHYAYVSGWEGIFVFDVSVPDEPVLLGSYQISSFFHSLALDGPFLYAVMHWVGGQYPGGLYIFNIAAPTNPILVDWFFFSGDWPELSVDKGIITVTTLRGGTYKFRFAESLSGTIVDGIGMPVPNLGLSLGNGREVVTDEQGKFALHALTKGSYQLASADGRAQLHSVESIFPPYPSYPYYPSVERTADTTAGMDTETHSTQDFVSDIEVKPATINSTWVVLPGAVHVDAPVGVDTTLQYTNARQLVTSFSVANTAITQTVQLHVSPILPWTGRNVFPTSQAFVLSLFGYMTGPLNNLPVQIAINYSDSDLTWIADEAALDLYRFTADGWVQASTDCASQNERTHDLDANRLEVTICGPGTYSLMGPTHQIFVAPLVK